MKHAHVVLVVAVAALGPFALAACGGPRKAAKSAPHGAVAVACTDGGVVAREPQGEPPPFLGPMVIVQPTQFGGALAEVGIDIAHLPPFADLDRRQKGRVMKTFAASLGIACVGCHDPDDFAKPSPRKEVAKKMWDEFARKMTLEDGSPLYCDSCHQGSPGVIDRRDKSLVAEFMDDVFVGKLKRIDGQDHDCGTCHGDPPDFRFVRKWKGGH